MTENEVAKQIVLGPGLWESAYEAVLAYELEKRGLRTIRQQAVPIVYQGTWIEMGFRADLIVEDNVIVEIKSVEAIAPVHKKQLLTHPRLADKRLGLLINFNVGDDQRRHRAQRQRHARLILRKDANAQRNPRRSPTSPILN